MKSWSPYALLVVVAIALDQWIKQLVEGGLAFQEKLDLVPFLALFRTYNTGIAFSMFSSFGDTGLVVIAIVVVAFVLYLATRTPAGHVLSRIGFALIIGGARNEDGFEGFGHFFLLGRAAVKAAKAGRTVRRPSGEVNQSKEAFRRRDFADWPRVASR